MLYFLVAFTAFNVLKQWNPMFGPQAGIHYSDDSCPSTIPHHLHQYTPTCTTYNTFPGLKLTLDDSSLGSILHLYYVAMAKARNPGCTTHNHSPGPMTHNLGRITESRSCPLSIQCHHLMMPVSVSGKWCHKVIMTSYSITDKRYNPSCRFNHINIMHNTYKMTENGCSRSITVPVYVLLCHLPSHIVQKLHKNYKHSARFLFLAINHSIYYSLNGAFNQAHDVKHWFKLLLSGLLRSQHISLWFITVTYLRICIIA